MDKSAQRAVFEEWIDDGFQCTLKRDKDGNYIDRETYAAWEAWQAATEQASQPKGTPGSRWAAEGQPDPHDNIYDCARAELTFGHLTDDELANAAFLNYDRIPDFQDVIDGKAHMPIAYMTAVKERIRWLSRRLAEATK